MTHLKRLVGWGRMFCLLAFLTFVACPSMHAQNSEGTILGHLTDSTGALVSGADVTITNVATNIKFTSKSNQFGIICS